MVVPVGPKKIVPVAKAPKSGRGGGTIGKIVEKEGNPVEKIKGQ